ncbi:MAG: hypothetical protein MZV63_45010 [Marinilabiliales bacterium]|nr:hypothetical protein [Marinilabiliales bacterium]
MLFCYYIKSNTNWLSLPLHSENLKQHEYRINRNYRKRRWDNKELLEKKATRAAIEEVISMLDKGQIRVAEPTEQGWILNEWIKESGYIIFSNTRIESYQSWPI